MHNINTKMRREDRVTEIFAVIIAENFPKMPTNTELQIQEFRQHKAEFRTKNLH